MLSEVLERIRMIEADLEQCRASVVHQLMLPITNPRHRILRDHFILQQAAEAKKLAEKLLDIYLDEDDIEKAREDVDNEETLLFCVSEFEGKAAMIRERFKRRPDTTPIVRSIADPDPDILKTIFSEAEHFGSQFDLQAHFDAYCSFVNSSKIVDSKLPPAVDMFKFTPSLASLLISGISSEQKLAAFTSYRSFVSSLLAYLKNFYGRIYPLELDQRPLQDDLAKAAQGYAEFSGRGKHKSYSVWNFEAAERQNISSESVRDVATMEAQIHKILMSSLNAVFQETIQNAARTATQRPDEIARDRDTEEREFLQSVLEARQHVNTAHTVVSHVVQAELDPVDSKAEKPSDDPDSRFVDANGEKLAKWQIKMMQLDKSFSCEVCGGEAYWGPKAFDEHFLLERHTSGLARLGVREQFTHLFAGITEIGQTLIFRDLVLKHLDATNLRKRIREDLENEETVDVTGVIVTKKDFANLHRLQ